MDYLSHYNRLISTRINRIPKSTIQANIAGSLKHAGNFIWKHK